MQIALPAVEIIHGDILMALDFLHSFLRRNPSARMTADVGMEHSFLGKGDVVNGEVDALWKFPTSKSMASGKYEMLTLLARTNSSHLSFE
ncbi:hypothetical protein AVEN_263477-1 [Araneus ventricosus]|uniref:Protein kinase domain-containing protein n=1 Tax=Araneus ventricosus TaxID=182803 RepID=A0A4Y2EVU7_ARAVE|nr:hypothetical protein AVEN_263477-1 [Araneus ventricosus]